MRWVLLVLWGCGGTTTPVTTTPGEEVPPPDADEVGEDAEEWASVCADWEPGPLANPEPVRPPLECSAAERDPTADAPPGDCETLEGDERSACDERRAARRRAGRFLTAGRRALGAGRLADALDALQRAAEVAPEDGGVLGELGWARFRVWRECREDPVDEYYEPEDEAELEALEARRTLCDRGSIDQAADDLGMALLYSDEANRDASIRYNLAQVARAMGEPAEAAEHLRISLCLRPHDSVRALYADVLWELGNREANDDPEGALARYRSATLVMPNADRQRERERHEAERRAGFELAPITRSPEGPFESFDALCEAMLEDEEPPDEEPCGVDGWTDDDEGSGAPYGLSVMRVSREGYDGFFGTFHLVARRDGAYWAVLDLGSEHGDSRMENAYVEVLELSVRRDLSPEVAVVRWVEGLGEAMGCDWSTAAWERMALCALEGDGVRCFARATTGTRTFDSDSMLPTVQESLGNCDEYDYDQETLPDEGAFTTSYDVELTAREIVATRREDERPFCFPYRETVCAIDGAPCD